MLRPPTSSFYRALTIAQAVSVVVGAECTFSLLQGPTISNQKDVDNLLGNCTSIEGTIEIAQNYTGSLLLANITSIDGSIWTNSDSDTYSLTSIEAPELTTIVGLYIDTASTLTNVSFPSLSTAQDIFIGPVAGITVEFPQLRSVYGDLRLTGNISSMVFSQLESVTGELSVIPSWPAATDLLLYLIAERVPLPPLDFDFPALKTAGNIEFAGNISSLNMPIANATNVDEGIVISTYGSDLDVNLASLKNAGTIAMFGTFGNISFPLLTSLHRYGLNCVHPIEANLGNLENVDFIDIYGNVTGRMTIDSSVPLDCSPATAAWKRAQPGQSGKYGFYCTSPHPPGWWPLGAKLGLGLGLPALLVILYFTYSSWKRNKGIIKDREKPPGYEPGAPPLYCASASEGTELTLVGGRLSRAGSIAESSGDTEMSDHQAIVAGEEVPASRP